MSKTIIDLVHLISWMRDETAKLMLENGYAEDEILTIYCEVLYEMGMLMEGLVIRIAGVCGEALAKETVWKPEITD